MPSRQPKPKKIEIPATKKPVGLVIIPGLYKVPKSKARPYSIPTDKP